MKKWTVNELREMFLSFFESKGHLRLPSFSLVPNNDNSLLIINSGMAPLKPYFKGIEVPPRKRVVTCQKCIRTGDIENIGLTARHGTFFEMLGNFSFGDYFKKEAITWSWEFLTSVIGLDKNRLYPSIYKDDDEAFTIWNEHIGVGAEKIYRFGKEDNFWEHGSGPCGPCSEIYYDRGEKYGCGKDTCKVGCDCDRFMEVWNNVFTQFDNDGNGNYTELRQKNIDTGMGLERLAVICQDVDSIFDIDTNKDLMKKISLISKHIYKENEKADISLRIIADHIKSCTFMISDGILPSNEGRGYVLRRLIRRAVRHGRLLGIKNIFMDELATTVISLNKHHYTELQDKSNIIFKVLKNEEEKFNETIDQGLNILNDLISNNKEITGDDVFKLYDTYGFPIDLTEEILTEKNIKFNKERFDNLMEQQKTKARNARKVSNYMGNDENIYEQIDKTISTEFVGYDNLLSKGIIKTIISNDNLVSEIDENETGMIITDKTPFYAQMGGQQGDIGKIYNDGGVFEVSNTIKVLDNKIGHIGKVVSGMFSVDSEVNLEVDKKHRHLTSINHTATHLLHAALREVLGDHVEQAGSTVASNRLHFDFTHFQSLTDDELKKVENLVNEKITSAIEVMKQNMKLDEAKKEGAMALFGEKYKDDVRTVKISNFSFELCGGTHVDNTLEIRCFKILTESAVATGVRRIEAITSDTLIDYYNNSDNILKNIIDDFKSTKNEILKKVQDVQIEIKKYKNDINTLQKQLSNNLVSEIKAESKNGLDYIIKKIDNTDNEKIKNISDTIKSKYQNYAIVLFGVSENKVSIVVAMSKKAIDCGLNANDILKKINEIVIGKGGGRDNFATGQSTYISKVDEAISYVHKNYF